MASVVSEEENPADDSKYRVRAPCKGPRIQVWLDDDLVIDYTGDAKGTTRGRVGVGTRATQAQFRNFKVTLLDGKTLHEGLPPLPEGNPGIAPLWRPFGSVKVSVPTEDPPHGKQCQRVESKGELGGLAQQPFCIRAGEVYGGSFWARGEAADRFFRSYRWLPQAGE